MVRVIRGKSVMILALACLLVPLSTRALEFGLGDETQFGDEGALSDELGSRLILEDGAATPILSEEAATSADDEDDELQATPDSTEEATTSDDDDEPTSEKVELVAADDDDSVAAKEDEDDDEETERVRRSWTRENEWGTGRLGVSRVGGVRLGKVGYGVGYGAVRVPGHTGGVGKSTLLKSYRRTSVPTYATGVRHVPRRYHVYGRKHITVPYYRRLTTTVRNLGPGPAYVRKVLTGIRHEPVRGGYSSAYRHLGSAIVPTIPTKPYLSSGLESVGLGLGRVSGGYGLGLGRVSGGYGLGLGRVSGGYGLGYGRRVGSINAW